MTVAAKEAAKQIKGVMATTTSTILVLFDAIVAVSVVDLASLGVAQDIVRLGYLDKLLMG
jgi:hypothetical protein